MDRPIRVLASDIQYYICKYNRLSSVAIRLFKEFLVGHFAIDFDLNVPPIEILQVWPEHLPNDLGIPKKHFDQPCFASRQLVKCNEIDNHNASHLARAMNHTQMREQILRISFFDILMANEDRNHNNYNLLFSIEGGAYRIHPIDHGACFNSDKLKAQPLTPLTLEDSLIYSHLFEALMPRKVILKLNFSKLKESFYLYLVKNRLSLPGVLSALPAAWNIDIDLERRNIETFLLCDQWFEECWTLFMQFLQRSI